MYSLCVIHHDVDSCFMNEPLEKLGSVSSGAACVLIPAISSTLHKIKFDNSDSRKANLDRMTMSSIRPSNQLHKAIKLRDAFRVIIVIPAKAGFKYYQYLARVRLYSSKLFQNPYSQRHSHQ